MRTLSFKQYLSTLEEDVDTDIANLTSQRQQLLIRKANQDRQIDNQIANIDRQLLQKDKQRQIDKKKNNPAADDNKQPQANQTVTPGSTGAQTPGAATSSTVPQR